MQTEEIPLEQGERSLKGSNTQWRVDVIRKNEKEK